MNRPIYIWALYYVLITVLFATTGFFLPFDRVDGFCSPCTVYIGLVFIGLILAVFQTYSYKKNKLESLLKMITQNYEPIAGGWFRTTNIFLSTSDNKKISILCKRKSNSQSSIAFIDNEKLKIEEISVPPLCTVEHSMGVRENHKYIVFRKIDHTIFFLPCDQYFWLNFKNLDCLVEEINHRFHRDVRRYPEREAVGTYLKS